MKRGAIGQEGPLGKNKRTNFIPWRFTPMKVIAVYKAILIPRVNPACPVIAAQKGTNPKELLPKRRKNNTLSHTLVGLNLLSERDAHAAGKRFVP